ncbi:hypothetical protein LOK49_LG06G01468 [Camellia lanceoleosa]|uniref:Uncharacterized protein n=1 Tax=Camellia lanceoleosa TaxID=1840588 RepID=A0ACC0H8I6_9ERIC|nr:hypothetical protein LOK49_LG06G01468 [Camellia lanceoleosa]
MDNSSGSNVNKSVVSKGTTEDVDEESGWTSYFDDFLSKQREEQEQEEQEEEEEEEEDVPEESGSPSLVSDAASCAVWKKINNNNQLTACPPISGSISPTTTMPKKLSFKKKRSKDISRDDSLEDTASSPANSPKVSSLKQMDLNPRKRDDSTESSVGKGGGGGTDFHSKIETDERNQMNIDRKINNEYTQLKKRGVCLVPYPC